MSSKFGEIQPRITELAALERLKIDVSIFFSLCMRTCICRRSSNFDQIVPHNME